MPSKHSSLNSKQMQDAETLVETVTDNGMLAAPKSPCPSPTLKLGNPPIPKRTRVIDIVDVNPCRVWRMRQLAMKNNNRPKVGVVGDDTCFIRLEMKVERVAKHQAERYEVWRSSH